MTHENTSAKSELGTVSTCVGSELETVSTARLAAILGVGESRIRQLAQQGALVRRGHGEYDLAASVQAYVRFVRRAARAGHYASQVEEIDALWREIKAVARKATDVRYAAIQRLSRVTSLGPLEDEGHLDG